MPGGLRTTITRTVRHRNVRLGDAPDAYPDDCQLVCDQIEATPTSRLGNRSCAMTPAVVLETAQQTP